MGIGDEKIHPECKMQAEWGINRERWRQVKEYMASSTAWRATVVGIVVTIAIQIGAFIYFWGGLKVTVETNSRAITDNRQEVKSSVDQLGRKIDKVLYKLE